MWTRQVPHNHTGYVCLSSRSSLDRDNWFTLIQLCLIIRKRSMHADGHTNRDRPSSPPPLLRCHFLLSAPNKLSIGLSSGKQLFFFFFYHIGIGFALTPKPLSALTFTFPMTSQCFSIQYKHQKVLIVCCLASWILNSARATSASTSIRYDMPIPI